MYGTYAPEKILIQKVHTYKISFSWDKTVDVFTCKSRTVVMLLVPFYFFFLLVTWQDNFN